MMKEPCFLLGKGMAGPQRGCGVLSKRVIPASVGNQFWTVKPAASDYTDWARRELEEVGHSLF